MAKKSGILQLPNFYRGANRLRNFFDEVYDEKKDVRPERFSWDFWHVPKQYKLHRTPAVNFFPADIINPFMESLVHFGRQQLGCHGITPLWLSAYTDGCEQRLHADRPHGPWAFVYSLSPKKPHYQGGETLILKDQILDYWSQSLDGRSFETSEIFHSIKPHFNQLTIFDPRVPHGVSRVSGSDDLKSARLVMHGWFHPPRPFIEGRLDPKLLERELDRLLSSMRKLKLFQFGTQGYVSFRFQVNKTGAVRQVHHLCSTLRHAGEFSLLAKRQLRELQILIAQLNFGKQKSLSSVTLPLEFRN